MEKKRLFTDEELKELESGFYETGMKALEEGDVEKAKQVLNEFESVKNYIHDGYARAMAKMLAEIYTRWGIDAYAEVIDKVWADDAAGMIGGKQAMKDAFGEEEGFRRWVKANVTSWKTHGDSKFHLEEDENEVRLVLEQCGSGGMLINTGLYDGGYGWIEEPGFWSYGDKGCGAYCGHCGAIDHNIVRLQGYPNVTMGAEGRVSPKKKGDCCIWHYVKNKEDFTQEYIDKLK